jgi:diphthine-ammonia ligase
MKLGVLCSGGKDSIYAAYLAMQKEDVTCFVSVLSKNESSYMFHTPNVSLVGMQAKAAGLPLVSTVTEGEKEKELEDLKDALERAREKHGIEGVVSGAIMSVYQASRLQRICREMDLWCFNPLWYTDQEAYLKSLIEEGFSVIISGVFSEPFDKSWLGRQIDTTMLAELCTIAQRYRITLTGEGGEFETFVLDAPFFKKRIVIRKASVTYRNFRGVYMIEEAELVEK